MPKTKNTETSLSNQNELLFRVCLISAPVAIFYLVDNYARGLYLDAAANLLLCIAALSGCILRYRGYRVRQLEDLLGVSLVLQFCSTLTRIAVPELGVETSTATSMMWCIIIIPVLVLAVGDVKARYYIGGLLLLSMFLLFAPAIIQDFPETHYTTREKISFLVATALIATLSVTSERIRRLFEEQQSSQLSKITFLSDHDEMTGLLNRRGVKNAIESRWAMVGGRRQAAAMLLIDIDNFKSINDRYGHEFGDTVIQGVASAIRSSVRSVDLVSRWGGEEFLVFIENTDMETVRKISRHILSATNNKKFSYEGIELDKISVSIGVSLSYEVDGFESLIALSDSRLYQAKKSGKNQCVFGNDFTPPV